MKFKDFKISKDSVLQSLVNAGFDFEECDSNMGAVLDINGDIMPVPQSFSLFETITLIDECVSIVRYVSENSNNYFNNTHPSYCTNTQTSYLSVSIDKCSIPAA